MVIRRFWIAIVFLLAAGIALAVQAQDAQPLTQPTIDAAVSTLIARTQQAPLQIGATQTIQAALEQAISATTQALITPTATPAPFDASTLTLSRTTEIDLLAGPGRTGAYLAPDGEHFAYLNDQTLCIYEGEQEQICNEELGRLGTLDSETIRWSPDSRYLTFTTDFYRTFQEPDIWVLDASSGALTDITDDGVTHVDIGGDMRNLDLFPRWTDDGQIVFIRYSRVSSGLVPPEIHRIAPDGSGDTILGEITEVDDLFAIFALDVWQDKLIYAYAAPGESPKNGVWISDLDGQNERQLMAATREAPISAAEMSPDGRMVLVKTENTTYNLDFTPENSWFRVVDATTGKVRLIDPERFVAGAGWSPEGSALVYTTYDPLADANSAVFLTDKAGKAGTQIMQGRFNIGTSLLRQALTWGENNTILLSRLPETGIVLVQLGS